MTKQTEYMRIGVTPDIRVKAQEKADAFKQNPYTWRMFPGRLLGFIGEEATYSWLAQYGEVEWPPSYDRHNYDLFFNGLKIDVKTKERNYTPRPYFEVTVGKEGMGTTQECDIYFGVSVNPKESYNEAWLVGYLHKKEFFDKAVFFAHEGKFSQIPTDRYNVEFSKLRPPHELLPNGQDNLCQ